MKIFKFFFFLLLVLDIESVFIPCAGSGYDNAYDLFSTVSNAGSPYATLPADVFIKSVKLLEGEQNCYNKLVEELKKTFVTKGDLDELKEQIGRVLINRATAHIQTDRSRLNFVHHTLRTDQMKDYIDRFMEYINTLGLETELLMEDARTFSHPGLKAATLTTAAMWAQELASLSVSWAVLTVKCYGKNLCSKIDMTTYSNELMHVGQRIWKCIDKFWQIERQLYQYRDDSKLLKWNGQINNFRTEHTGECNRPSHSWRARRYVRHGGSCAYKDSGYQKHNDFKDMNRKWESKTKSWRVCGCGPSTCNSNVQDGSQLCDKEDNGYPRNKMAKWLADDQRVKLRSLFDSYFKFNGRSIQSIVNEASFEVWVRSSDYEAFMNSFPFWGRRSLSDCNVDDFTQDELDQMSKEIGIMNFPICTPEPPLPMDHIYQEILESVGKDIEIVHLDEVIEDDNLNSFDEDVETEKEDKNENSVDNAEESSDNESDRRLLRLYRLSSN